jgi:hypothetical protein
VRRVLVLLLKEKALWVCSFLCVCECVLSVLGFWVSFERETLFGLYILYVFVKVFACSGFFCAV